MTDQYTLYGTPFSLYTGKIRAYLKYKSIPFSEQLSTIRVYKKTIIPKTGVRFVPVVRTPENTYLQDTANIIDTLEERFPSNPVVPESHKLALVSSIIELFADEWLVIPAMHYRWNHPENFPFIYEEFGTVVSPRLPRFMRAWMGQKIGARFKGYLPMLGISDQTHQAIESWYEGRLLPILNAHFSNHAFLLGERPSLGDFCLMGPLYAHLARDPAPKRIMQEKAPAVFDWVSRMNNPDSHSQSSKSEQFTLAATLYPLLEQAFLVQWPVLEETALAVNQWAKTNSGQLPRSLGVHAFSIGECQSERAVLPFHQWKLQRVLDAYKNISDDEVEEVTALLKAVGGYEKMQLSIPKRLTRKDNKLVFED